MGNSYRNRERFVGDSGYLIHFGIKGQKWGVRRYQNEDGSLTEEGRRRYLSEDSIAPGVFQVYLLYVFPGLRKGLKNRMVQSVSKIVNTKAVGGTLLKAKKMIDHMKTRKAAAVIVKAKDAWISGDLLGA